MRVMTLGGLGRAVRPHTGLVSPRPQPTVVIPSNVVRVPSMRGLRAVDLTDALGVGAIAFVVGGSIGFAVGAAVAARARGPRW